MNIILWILAALLAAVFAAVGMTKLTKSREELITKMPLVADFSDSQVKAVGALEVLGAIGLILPALLDIAPILVPIAATGIALMMVGAVVVHVRNGDSAAHTAPAAALGVIALVVAIGRFGPYAF